MLKQSQLFSLFAALAVMSASASETAIQTYNKAQAALKKGDKAAARKLFLESCREGTDGACVELGKLSTTPELQKELDASCKNGQKDECLALAVAKAKTGDRKGSKTDLINLCNEKSFSNRTMACSTAISMITLPDDVKKLVDSMEECTHWLGEEGYDDKRRKEIEKAVEENCTDVSADVEKLRSKYKSNSDLLFVLAQVEENDED